MTDAIAQVAGMIESAEEICDPITPAEKPRLKIEDVNPERTVENMRQVLARCGSVYDRGGIVVSLTRDATTHAPIAKPMSADALTLKMHQLTRPFRVREKDGLLVESDARLPRTFAVMYADAGEWGLPPFNGVAAAPLLREDGSIFCSVGYDASSGMWLDGIPPLEGQVPQNPTKDDAARALLMLRSTFSTFSFADADMSVDVEGTARVDLQLPPAHDESALLTAIVTGVCRPSIATSPAILIRAPNMSGAGAGKGLLGRCICKIAFGREPHAVTSGGNLEELEKRIAAELIEGHPALFIDNVNSGALKSELLASAITEHPSKIRLLGRSIMVPLNASALILVTGNGINVSEDLARRFLTIELDPRVEDPELREFKGDIRQEIGRRRVELLAAALTIWRWGRQTQGLPQGRPLGSFPDWCRWVRDPLVALGCKDPADRISEAKTRDPRRQQLLTLFQVWADKHGEDPVAARDLEPEVKDILDPRNRGRQHIAAQLEKFTGTRIGGRVLYREAPAGKWGAAKYTLVSVSGAQTIGHHRDHRRVENVPGAARAPKPPMTPNGSDPLGMKRAPDLRVIDGPTTSGAAAAVEVGDSKWRTSL